MKKGYIYKYKLNSVFIKTFLALIMLSVIPIIATNTIIYRRSTATIKKQTRNINMNMLVKTSETVDLIFQQVDQIIQQVAKDSDTVDLIIDPDKDSMANNRKIVSNLMNMAFASEYISSAYIYSAYTGKVLSSNGGVYALEDFYDTGWVNDYTQFFLGTDKLETREVSDSRGNKSNCITLIRNIPYKSWSKLGAVIINISEELLYKTISGVDSAAKGEIYVINRKGEILAHRSKDKLRTNLKEYTYIDRILKSESGDFVEEIDGRQILFSYVTSSYNGWKYIYRIPLGNLYTDSRVVSRIIIIATFISILLGLIFSYLLSKGIYNPIQRLVTLVLNSSKSSSIRGNRDIKNEYEFLGYAYNDVIDKNKDMEETLNDIKPIIKEKLFTNLIFGKAGKEKEITEKLNLLNISFGLKNFIVIAIQIDNYNEFCDRFNEIQRNLLKLKLMNMVESIVQHKYKGVCVETESDKFAVIINCSDNTAIIETKKEVLEIISKMKNEIEGYFPFTVTAGLGRMYENIDNIKLSYKEALNALEYKVYQGKSEIINIDDIDMESQELYYYDSEKEKMIINNLKIGQGDEVEVLIDELVDEILENRNIPGNYIQQVFIRLINSIIELIINMGMTLEGIFGKDYNLYEELSNKETIKDIRAWLIQVCNKIIENINHINVSESQKNAEEILKYIDENLDKEISLQDIADWIGFSKAYVSKVFKEHTGKNYINYLNGNRIEKAKQLLKDTKLSVKEVGFRVGFNNIQTFMRTFKRYEGITPGQYRDKT